MANLPFMQLPAVEAPRSALLDFAPLAQAFRDYNKGAQLAARGEEDRAIGQTAASQGYGAAGKQALSMGRLDEGVKFADAGQGQRDALTKRYGVLAQQIDTVQDPQQRARMWAGTLERMKRDAQAMGVQGEFDPDELDPVQGPKLFMAQAGVFNDPIERETAEAKLGLLRAQTQATQNKGNASGNRLGALSAVGIDPNSAEGKAFLLSGKLPAAAYQNLAQEQRKNQTAPKIAEGLQNLNRMTDQYNDASFTNALGPIQGSTPDSLLGAIPVNIARLFGEAWNSAEGGNASPNEVRNNVVGATEALAAAIKPLIRGAGEGVWTDADQARLVSIVGDLSQARNKREYQRRLNAVRDRIQSNFGLEIPFDAGGGEDLAGRQGPFVQKHDWTEVGGVRIREKR